MRALEARASLGVRIAICMYLKYLINFFNSSITNLYSHIFPIFDETVMGRVQRTFTGTPPLLAGIHRGIDFTSLNTSASRSGWSPRTTLKSRRLPSLIITT